MVIWHRSHLAHKKRYTSISTWLMATKLDKMMDYDIGPIRTKSSHDSLITWPYVVKQKTLHLQFHKSYVYYGHQTWHGGSFLAGNYMFKVNSRNIRARCEICLKLTIKTPERGQWRGSGVFIVNFKHISHFVLVFLLLTWGR